MKIKANNGEQGSCSLDGAEHSQSNGFRSTFGCRYFVWAKEQLSWPLFCNVLTPSDGCSVSTVLCTESSTSRPGADIVPWAASLISCDSSSLLPLVGVNVFIWLEIRSQESQF